MNVNISVFGIVIALTAIAVWFFKKNSNNKQIEKIEQEKVAVKAKIETVDQERASLKEKVDAEHKNATEEKKKDFWNNYLKKD